MKKFNPNKNIIITLIIVIIVVTILSVTAAQRANEGKPNFFQSFVNDSVSFVDRAISADSIDILSDMALILFALHSGRSIYLDIAMVTAVLGFIGSVMISRYLEGRL